MDAAGVELRVAPQRRLQRAHAVAGERGFGPSGASRAGSEGYAPGGRGGESARERRRGVQGEAAVVERAAEGALEARDQLDALEAPEADLALERGLRGDRALGPGAARLAREGPRHLEHEVERFLGPGPGCRQSLDWSHWRHSTGAGRHAQTSGTTEA